MTPLPRKYRKIPDPWRNVDVNFIHIHNEDDPTHSRKEGIQLKMKNKTFSMQMHKCRRN
jgi:hypothetical protein